MLKCSFLITEAYPGLPQTSKVDLFETIGKGFEPLTFVAKLSILDIAGVLDTPSRIITIGIYSLGILMLP